MVHLVLTRLASWSNEFTRDRQTHTHAQTRRKEEKSWGRNILDGARREKRDGADARS